MALFPFYLLDDLRDEEGKDKKSHGEGHLPGKETVPAPPSPYVPHRPHEKGEDEDADDDAQGGAEKVIPEAHPGQPHAEIHRGGREKDEPQIEERGECVALDRDVVLC